jgi:hypothetical protein
MVYWRAEKANTDPDSYASITPTLQHSITPFNIMKRTFPWKTPIIKKN